MWNHWGVHYGWGKSVVLGAVFAVLAITANQAGMWIRRRARSRR